MNNPSDYPLAQSIIEYCQTTSTPCHDDIVDLIQKAKWQRPREKKFKTLSPEARAWLNSACFCYAQNRNSLGIPANVYSEIYGRGWIICDDWTHLTPKGFKDNHWDDGRNCLICGEAGRCNCK